MIVYSATKSQFMGDVLANEIERKKILTCRNREVVAMRPGKAEVASWAQLNALYE